MGTNSNSTLTSLILLATISTSVVCLPYDTDSLIPRTNANYVCYADVSDWKDSAFNQSGDYNLQFNHSSKIQTIIEFSKKLVENSVDIDQEYVDIVNDNFWDLI
jgi:hypothetical protein